MYTRTRASPHRTARSHESQGQDVEVMPTDRNLLDQLQRASSSQASALSLSAPFILEIKCVTAASLETSVDVERNGEISAQLAFQLTGLGELKA